MSIIKRLLIALTSIGLLLLAGGCGTEGNKETPAENGNLVSEEPAQPPDSAADADYSGTYVDKQGTEDIYSQLSLVSLEDRTYSAAISLCRLAFLEGTAEIDGETLFFKDTIIQVSGKITLSEGGAIFAITESEFADIAPGAVFEFPEKTE